MRLALINVLLTLLWNIEISSQLPERPEKLKRADSFFGVHSDLHAREDIMDAGKT